MDRLDRFDPALGIQQVLEVRTSRTLPDVRHLASTVETVHGLEALFAAGNARSIAEEALRPDVGDGALCSPAAFFSALAEGRTELEANGSRAALDFVQHDLDPLLADRELFNAYVGLMIGG